jgi:hypothetical protein
MIGLCQYEDPPRLQGLDLRKLFATILDKHIVQQPEFGRTVRMSRPIRKFIVFSSPLLLGIPPVDQRNFFRENHEAVRNAPCGSTEPRDQHR